jgi:hypothetical protein
MKSNTISTKLTPIRAAEEFREDDQRSKTILRARERLNRSMLDDTKANIAIDGYSINGDRVKPRALS